MRTYMSTEFPGLQLVLRLEMEENCLDTRETRKIIPRLHGRHSGPEDSLRNWVDFYGYRGTHPAVYYLSPWEFLMHWEVMPLPKPKQTSTKADTAISRWQQKKPPKKRNSADEASDDYEPNPMCRLATKDVSAAIVFFEAIPGEAQLRNRWHMRRRLRPMVPAPNSTPMPDKQQDKDLKARLFALYLRPWVLEPKCASVSQGIPHLGDLNIVGSTHERSYSKAWSTYARTMFKIVY